jgi:D-glycero-alpha-D-manno-heptose-7-phosphate kinase
MLESLRFTERLGRRITDALERGDTGAFADLMHEHWEYKRSRSSGMSNEQIDAWYQLGLAHGARGGKLVGAGAGGFLLFYADEPQRLRAAISREGLNEVRFFFDHDGSLVIVRD